MPKETSLCILYIFMSIYKEYKENHCIHHSTQVQSRENLCFLQQQCDLCILFTNTNKNELNNTNNKHTRAHLHIVILITRFMCNQLPRKQSMLLSMCHSFSNVLYGSTHIFDYVWLFMEIEILGETFMHGDQVNEEYTGKLFSHFLFLSLSLSLYV